MHRHLRSTGLSELASDTLSETLPDMIKELTENSTLFQEIQVEYSINEYVNQINSQGKAFLKDYLSELSNTVLSDDEQITLIDLAIKMIEADKQVLYSEVKFFKKIRSRITVSDEQILLKLSGIEDYLQPDICAENKDFEDVGGFKQISF